MRKVRGPLPGQVTQLHSAFSTAWVDIPEYTWHSGRIPWSPVVNKQRSPERRSNFWKDKAKKNRTSQMSGCTSTWPYCARVTERRQAFWGLGTFYSHLVLSKVLQSQAEQTLTRLSPKSFLILLPAPQTPCLCSQNLRPPGHEDSVPSLTTLLFMALQGHS